jgi:inorganic pyrophosphatase
MICHCDDCTAFCNFESSFFLVFFLLAFSHTTTTTYYIHTYYIQGDNDPVDVVEIGSATCEMGGIYEVKPVGVYAMLDDGEVDWKVIAIRTDDPKASSIHDVEDVEREFPGELGKIMEWFRDYKIPDGKPANAFGYDSACLNKEFAMHVIQETHGFYTKLKSGERDNSEGLSLI